MVLAGGGGAGEKMRGRAVCSCRGCRGWDAGRKEGGWRGKRGIKKDPPGSFFSALFQPTRWTLPARRQRVQIFKVLVVPLIFARIFLMFGFQTRLVLMLE